MGNRRMLSDYENRIQSKTCVSFQKRPDYRPLYDMLHCTRNLQNTRKETERAVQLRRNHQNPEDYGYDDRPGEGYIPAYTRTDLTDALHDAFGFRSDYQITSQKKYEKNFKSDPEEAK